MLHQPNKLIFISTLLILSLSLAIGAEAQSFKAKAIQIEDGQSIQFVDINESGDILGYYAIPQQTRLSLDGRKSVPFLYNQYDGLKTLDGYFSTNFTLRDLSDSGNIVATVSRESDQTDAEDSIEILDAQRNFSSYLTSDYENAPLGQRISFTDAQFADNDLLVIVARQRPIEQSLPLNNNFSKIFWGTPEAEISYDLELGQFPSLAHSYQDGSVILNITLQNTPPTATSQIINALNESQELPSVGTITRDTNYKGDVLAGDSSTIFKFQAETQSYKQQKFACRGKRKRRGYTLQISGISDEHFVGWVSSKRKKGGNFAVSGKLTRTRFNCGKLRRRFIKGLSIEANCSLTRIIATNRSQDSVAEGTCNNGGEETKQLFSLEALTIKTNK